MKKNKNTKSTDTELTGQLAKDGFELGAVGKTSPIEQHFCRAERIDRLYAELDSLHGEVARLTAENQQLRDSAQADNTTEPTATEANPARDDSANIGSSTNNGMPDYEVIASWKDEYFADCPDDFHYEDAAIILQAAGNKLVQILDELPELPLDKVDETGMRNVRGQARWVRLKAHIALLLIRSIRAREKRMMKFGG